MAEQRKRKNLKFEFPELHGEARIRELILYIAGKCADDPSFGATKLNKILFFSDFTSFGEHGHPITGVKYQRLQNGPAPECLIPVRVEMEKAGEVAISYVLLGQFKQHRVVPLREPHLESFSAQDIAVVDHIIDALWGVTATEVSELSHKRAWKIAGDRELIPYDAALISDEAITDYEINRTKELARKYGWSS